MFNVTVANGMGVTGYIRGVSYAEDDWSPGYEDLDVLDVQVEYGPVLWPWSGCVDNDFFTSRLIPVDFLNRNRK